MKLYYDNFEKIWSIYVEEVNINSYVDVIREVVANPDYDISKRFFMTNPFDSSRLRMVVINLVCTEDQMDIIMDKLGLENV